MKIFIDDERNPQKAGWEVVRSHKSFTALLNGAGAAGIDIVEFSFDHDLGIGPTGYDCAKYYIDQVVQGSINGHSLQRVIVHSANTVGLGNIIATFKSGVKHDLLNPDLAIINLMATSSQGWAYMPVSEPVVQSNVTYPKRVTAQPKKERTMSEQLARLRSEMIAAMKAGDKQRKSVISLIVNEAQQIGKNDPKGPRDATDDDVIQALNRTIKKATETREGFLSRGDATDDQDFEIAVAREFLPQQMTEAELEALINTILDTTDRGKSARGVVMKALNSEHKGKFDNKLAGEILGRLLA